MLTLAIDTATKVCTIALCRDKEILAEYTINMGINHIPTRTSINSVR